MTTLREKMKQEMILVGLAKSTQEIYLKAVSQLYNYYNKSPQKLTEQEIKSYLLYLRQDKKLAPNKVAFIVCATHLQHTKEKIMRLAPEEFIRRFLSHVVPDGFMRIRSFGFMANAAKPHRL